MAIFPDKAWCDDLHRRLLTRDPIASALLCKALLPPLIGWLHKKARTTDEELIRDAATDAVVDYLKRPDRWSAEKGTLISYLCMAADRDLLNSIAKSKLREERELLFEDVELQDFARNEEGKEAEGALASEKLLVELEKHLASEADRRFLQAMLEGERSTEQFAAILGIRGLPKLDKARVVKQTKDRLKKVLERLGRKLDGTR